MPPKNTLQLVEYSDDSDDSQSSCSSSTKDVTPDQQISTKKRKLPPLPDFLEKLYPDKKKTNTDSNEDHQGRIRSVGYFAGNWATFVHIEINLDEEFSTLIKNIQKSARDLFPKGSSESLYCHDETSLTLSLSRTVYLKWSHIDRFRSILTDQLKGVQSFEVSFSGLVRFDNEEKTRSFLSLDVHPSPKGPASLRNLLLKVDLAMAKLDLPLFYQPPHFHVSILWTKPPHLISSSFCDKLQLRMPKLIEELGTFSIPVRKVVCKTGNLSHVINLS